MNVSILPVCMDMHYMGTWSSKWSKDGLKNPEFGIMDGCDPPCKYCKTSKSCLLLSHLFCPVLIIYDQY